MSARDSEATKRRILSAAAIEFAAVGIAGARVDRIAENAQANKAMLYRYFQSKDELFNAVFSAHVLEFVDSVRFDPDDLPGYAGRLFDSYRADPMTLQLTHWYQLERAAEPPLEVLGISHRAKLSGIVQAQRRGVITTAFRAAELLAIVRGVAMAWDNLTPELQHRTAGTDAAHRRTVVDAVSRLVAL